MKMEQRIEEEETGKEAESVREAHWHFASPCGRGTQGRRAAATSSGQDSAELTGACVQPGKSSQQPAANNQQPAAHRETETC